MSLLCPAPANISITSNTFVQFQHEASVKVGLVLNLNPTQRTVSLRLFLSWKDVMERIGTLSVPQNISFWPMDNRYPPHYLCDTDLIVNDVHIGTIIGLAFVFYDTSSKIKDILGMKNTYRVTSCVWFSRHLITHGNTFKPFPSERFPSIILSCFPSTLFSQLICVKHELQRVINTRSLSSKNSATVRINNIDMYTWMYMLKGAPVAIEAGEVVSRGTRLNYDEFTQYTRRETQLSLWIGDSHHLAFAQALFGLSFGIGVRFTVSCRLPRGESYAEESRQISASSTLNVIPFENSSTELVRRGIHFRYKPVSRILSLTVRYRRLNGHQNFYPHLEARGMVHLPAEDGPDIYPFYRDVLVDGCYIQQYNITSRSVRLSDNRHLSVEEVIALFNRDLL